MHNRDIFSTRTVMSQREERTHSEENEMSFIHRMQRSNVIIANMHVQRASDTVLQLHYARPFLIRLKRHEGGVYDIETQKKLHVWYNSENLILSHLNIVINKLM